MGGYQGDCILFTRWGDAKVFDGDRGVVLHFISSTQKYVRLKSTYDTFRPFFNIPVKGYYDAGQIIIERYITGENPTGRGHRDKERVLHAYCRSQSAYLRHCVQNGYTTKRSSSSLWDHLPHELKVCPVAKRIYKYLSEAWTKEWVYAKCHGDMHFDNVLPDGYNHYFMDWEFCGSYPMFFDFLHFVAREACVKGDSSLLVAYLNGEYDHLLERLFSNASMEFVANEKPLYMCLSILQRATQDTHRGSLEGVPSWLVLANEVLKYAT